MDHEPKCLLHLGKPAYGRSHRSANLQLASRARGDRCFPRRVTDTSRQCCQRERLRIACYQCSGCSFVDADITSSQECWRDNVFVERPWRSVKHQEVYLHAYQSVPRTTHPLLHLVQPAPSARRTPPLYPRRRVPLTTAPHHQHTPRNCQLSPRPKLFQLARPSLFHFRYQ